MSVSRRAIPTLEQIAQLPADGGPDWNRLIFEKSPYLLQHAANPVDWRPWGEAAFEEARRSDKPVFLSIGYTTCHWCHVMEHECFEDAEVAALMNRYFVPIKVDREERPDVDNVYMSVCQALTGSGGWPLNAALTPERKPFFAGTYFSKRGMHGRPGMMDLIPALAQAWSGERKKVLESADQITKHVLEGSEAGAKAQRGVGVEKAGGLSVSTLETCYLQLMRRFDSRNGGFGDRPKFPTPHNLVFLLRYYRYHGEPKALEMAVKTLRAMRDGGIFDHVGFGFHRYSTDSHWLVPHFEKMLYDQALLAMAYTEAFLATGDMEHQLSAREIFAYVMRDMTSPEGGFYAAEDADSEGIEGKFYVWPADEIVRLLGSEEGELYNRFYNVTAEGNFDEEATGDATGLNIPHRKRPLSDFAAEMKLEPAAVAERLEAARELLFAEREKRIHPQKDDKILTDWNGLSIAALAQAAQAFGEPAYAQAARRAADFVWNTLRDADGRLLKRYRQGEAGLTGLLEDYAYYIWGLLDLYEATFDTECLRRALELAEIQIGHFEDPDGGGYYITPDFGERLIVRNKEIYDGAQPSGNSVAAMNWLRLSRLTGDTRFEEKADGIFGAFAERVAPQAMAHTQLMAAVSYAAGPTVEVVIAGNPYAADTRAMIEAVRNSYCPQKAVLVRDLEEDSPIAELAGYTRALKAIDGRATAYVCRNFACGAPTTDPAELTRMLAGE